MTGTKFAKHFQTATREPSGEMFQTLRDGAPEWLRDAVRAAHGDKLPHDWIYAECRCAVEAFDEGTLNDDSLHEHVDGQVDTYTSQLFSWANEFCLSSLFSQAEDEASEMWDNTNTLSERLRFVQFYALQSIWSTMLQACQEAYSEEDVAEREDLGADR